MPETAELIGFIAAFLTTYAFVPQAVKVWREDETKAISLGMYSLTVAGIGMWLVYGVILDSLPLIIANTITFCLASSILYKKIKHVREGRA